MNDFHDLNTSIEYDREKGSWKATVTVYAQRRQDLDDLEVRLGEPEIVKVICEVCGDETDE